MTSATHPATAGSNSRRRCCLCSSIQGCHQHSIVLLCNSNTPNTRNPCSCTIIAQAVSSRQQQSNNCTTTTIITTTPCLINTRHVHITNTTSVCC